MDESDSNAAPQPNSSSEQQPSEVESEELARARALVGTIVADRYEVLELLGEGAMGAVYRARHVHMQKDVALKVLHHATSQNPEVVRRFEREAVAAGRVEHPNVATATDFGRLEGGSFYLVMEYIRGQSLGQLIDREAPLEPARVARLGLQIAAALSAAHSAKIVHRDLKPENVMLPEGEPGVEFVKVLDFGMAKLQQADTTETKLTMHGAVYGTPMYMAPEQASGQEVDRRADLYALGIMLQEMLTGEPPFVADTMMALLVKHMTEEPQPLPPSVPKQLSRLIARLLKKKPEERVQSADEVMEALGDFLGIPAESRGTLGSAPFAAAHLASVGGAVGVSPRPPSAAHHALAAAGEIRDQVADKMAQMAPVVEEKVAPLVKKAGSATAPLIAYLKQPMTVAGRSFPRWVPAAVGLGFFAVLGSMVLGGGEEEAEEVQVEAPAAPPVDEPQELDAQARDPQPPDPELLKVILAAERGSDPALYALEQREDAERSLTEWMGLSKARLMRKEVEGGLSAFKEAIARDESMQYDDVVLSALRRLADEPQHSEMVLEFAADELGSLGADLLFDVWAKTSLKTAATTMAYDKLTSLGVARRYSPELKVAMALRSMEQCEDYKKILPEVVRVGDERTLTRLRKLAKESGCGSSKRDDCYPCLRDDDTLKEAIQAAAMRKAPRFAHRRFRFKE